MVDSDDVQFLALRERMLEEELVSNIVQRLPIDEDLCHRVVQEEIQKLLSGGARNDLPKERRLQLKFLGEVSNSMTGVELKWINDECLKLALLDSDEHIVTCGRESFAKVEILLLDNNGNGGDNNMTLEKFEGSIIQTGEKKKPHFAKSVYVSLKKGVGDLNGLKLGHDSDRIKPWSCRIGARIAQNLEGTTVQEAWTAPFEVIDRRDRMYDKHYPPSLKSEVWRLEGIGKNGKPCEHLKEKNIKTLQDFLFWFYLHPEGLKQMLGAGDRRWNTIVTHAETCIIDDKKMYSLESSTEPQMCLIYDAVGRLKGEIIESHFVLIDNLSADKKDRARKLLSSVLEPPAFGERYNSSFNDEASLPQQFPSRSSENDASSNSPIQQFLNGNDLTLSENIHGIQTTARYEKRETTSLFDEVSRLVNICEDGEIYKRLRDNKISTVEDFLIRLLRDHEGLKRIVNLDGQKWEATVNKARACPTAGSRMYCYTNLEQKMSVIFNVLGDVVGLCFDHHFVPTSSLPEKLLKDDAEELLARGRRNWRNVKVVNDMNHLQQHLSGGGNQINVSSPSKMISQSSNSATDYMEMMLDAETPDNRAGECIDVAIFLDGADDDINSIKQQFPNLCVGSNISWKWKRLLCVIKWCFSNSGRLPHHHVTRKRKR